MAQYPDKRLEDECVQFWLHRIGWTILAPYAQWNYWHILKDSGGVVPLDVDLLIERYFSSPLSQDETANNHRRVVYKKIGDRYAKSA